MVSQIIVEGILSACSSSAVNLPRKKHEGGWVPTRNRKLGLGYVK